MLSRMLEKFTETRNGKGSAMSFMREAASNSHIGSAIQDVKFFYLYIIDTCICMCV